MGVKAKKKREKKDMKQAILNTATEMYLKEGFDNLSIRAVAQRMEYAVGTMYLYYKNKAELIQTIMEEGFNKMIKNFRSVSQGNDPLVNLEQIMIAYIDFALKNPEYYDLMLISSKPSDVGMEDECWENGLGAFDILVESIQTCIDQKLLKYDNAETASLHIWSFLHGLSCLYLKKHLLPFGDPDQDYLQQSIRQFLTTLKS